MNYRPKCKMQNCKTSRIKHMRKSTQTLASRLFLRHNTKRIILERKLGKLNFIKIRNIHSEKDI